MNDQQQNSTRRPFEETFSPAHVPDEAHVESSAGPHQRLIRTAAGEYYLIVRRKDGLVQRITVRAFEGGWLV